MLRQMVAVGTVAVAMITAAPIALAAVDTVAPSVPAGVRQIGQDQGQAVYGWDAATDNVGVAWYSIKLDGSMVRKDTKRTMQVRVYDLYLYCHALPGHSYTLTIEAVDAAGNHSAPSEGVLITVA